MSAAAPLPQVWGEGSTAPVWRSEPRDCARRPHQSRMEVDAELADDRRPEVSLAFYRRHTERLLRRYLYASMLIGRAPSVLGDPVARGWASSRPVRTFEDAVIFVLDVERCLSRLDNLDQQILSRVVLQEYTQAEAAPMLGMRIRTMSYRFLLAMDRLTEQLLADGLLIVPG